LTNATNQSLVFHQCAVCLSGTFQPREGQIACFALDPECQPGFYQSLTPTSSSNRVCTKCSALAFSSLANQRWFLCFHTCCLWLFIILNSSCTGVRNCSALEFETARPTITSDRQCALCSLCNGPNQFAAFQLLCFLRGQFCSCVLLTPV
jgi:hypothetical protein